MKKSILKSVVSVFAAAVMVVTSANLVLAENDYMSYSNDFSSASGVTINNRVNGDGKVGDIVMEVADGVLKSTRTKYNGQNGEKAEGASASFSFGDKSFSKGKVQVKFDFTLNEGRAFVVTYDGYQTKKDSGLYIREADVRLIYPNGTGFGTATVFEEAIAVDTEYTLTATLDIVSQVFAGEIVKKNDPTNVKTFKLSMVDGWAGGETPGAVTGVSIRSVRAQDMGTGTMIFDNLSVDAYTESNYEVNSIYRSTDGLETNKKMDGYTFKGYALSKLTNIPAPANASFITAAYDGEGRMTNAVAKPVSEVGSAPVNADVAGDTVKSFVLDMSNANPLMPVYQYADPARTMRKLDFEFDGDYKVGDPYVKGVTAKWVADIQAGDGIYGITWNGYENAGVGYEKVLDGENNVLKVERSTFKSGNDYYNYKDGVYTLADSNTAQNNNLTIGFDKESNAIKVTFKFKFEGTENTSQVQRIAVLLGGVNVFISRDQSGAGNVQRGVYPNSAEVCTWTDMKAGEWYTFTAEMTSSGAFSSSVAGEFNSGYAVKNGTNTIAGAAIKRLEIGSPRDMDVVDKNLTDVKTTSSVWYIDDIVVEY